MQTLLAFDTSYLYFRAFFGVPDRFHAQDGRPVNAVRGTLDFISALTEKYSPDSIVCAWDDDWRPQWRVDLVGSYKSHRLTPEGAELVEEGLQLQIPMIRQALEAVGLPIVGAADHEADDVLASLAQSHPGNTLVVTGDRDLFQLISPQTSVVYVAQGVAKHEVITAESLVARYGVEPSRYVDFAVLRGDPSDGLPGVAGIGEKTAASLVQQYPSLDAMVAAAQDPASGMSPSLRRKLLADPAYLTAARQVVSCVTTLKLAMPRTDAASPAEIDQLSQEWGLGSRLQRLYTLTQS